MIDRERSQKLFNANFMGSAWVVRFASFIDLLIVTEQLVSFYTSSIEQLAYLFHI